MHDLIAVDLLIWINGSASTVKVELLVSSHAYFIFLKSLFIFYLYFLYFESALHLVIIYILQHPRCCHNDFIRLVKKCTVMIVKTLPISYSFKRKTLNVDFLQRLV